MQNANRWIAPVSFFTFVSLALSGCGGPVSPVNTSLPSINATNRTLANRNSNTVSNTNSAPSASIVNAAEPADYQATVTLTLEAMGDQQRTALPPLTATVARSGMDRRMVFTMPAGGRVVYLDKAGTNYLILPEKRQYAELNQESMGFEVRRMLMPEQIVEQVKNLQGVRLVGDEVYKGRDAVRYAYGAVADTQSRAGQVATESFLIVDKATGLPLRSEIVSQSQSGGNVQGYSGVRVITEITDIQTQTVPADFVQPTEFQKIESDQVRGQVDMIFNAIAGMLAQMMNQAQQR
jgi:hypothetical protein